MGAPAGGAALAIRPSSSFSFANPPFPRARRMSSAGSVGGGEVAGFVSTVRIASAADAAGSVVVWSSAAVAVAAADATGAGAPCSVTVTSEVAGAREDLPRRSSTLVPIMTRNSAAMAVCGRMAQLPARDTARATRRRSGTTFCASRTAARMRSSRSAGGSTSGTTATRRVALSPPMRAAQRAQPATCRFAAALVSSSSSP